jgi:hypothetical protein
MREDITQLLSGESVSRDCRDRDFGMAEEEPCQLNASVAGNRNNSHSCLSHKQSSAIFLK